MKDLMSLCGIEVTSCGVLQVPTVICKKKFLSLMKQTRHKRLLYVVRQQEETGGYSGCQLTLRAFAWQQIGRKS